MRIQFIFICVILLFSSCNNPGDKNLVGDWEIIEFTIYQQANSSRNNEKALRNAGAVWNLNFSGNGKFQQDFNMDNKEKTMKTQKGSWTALNDSLKIVLHIDTITSRMNYTYKLNKDILTMDLQHPITKEKIISRFKRKQSK